MQPPLAAHLMLEVLHRVGDEDLFAIDARLLQRLVEHTTGWTDEGMAIEIFIVARLLANQHQRRMSRALSGNRLGGELGEIAASAGVFRFAQRLQRTWRFLA